MITEPVLYNMFSWGLMDVIAHHVAVFPGFEGQSKEFTVWQLFKQLQMFMFYLETLSYCFYLEKKRISIWSMYNFICS